MLDNIKTAETWDLVCVGSGFASTFFCKKYLQNKPDARVLILERGPHLTHQDQLMDPNDTITESPRVFRNLTPQKSWYFKLRTGGSSNCWAGSTPRWQPNDFNLNSLYGQGVDWPFDYDELEPYYSEAESIMLIAGPANRVPYRMSSPYPLPEHSLSDPCRAMMDYYPEHWFPLPNARATRPNSSRTTCCHSMRCNRCPVDAKFTILNGMSDLLDGTNVTLKNDCEVTHMDIHSNVVKRLNVKMADGKRATIAADLVVLGANAIMNPFLLLKSGLDGGKVGTGISEQPGFRIDTLLNGMESGQGSTTSTSIGYNWYDGSFRKNHAGAMIISHNMGPFLRDERNRWLERHIFSVEVEDLPLDSNKVSIDPKNPEQPLVEFHGMSEYARKGIVHWKSKIESLLSPLPVEDFSVQDKSTHYHIQCSTRMGTDPDNSVVDANCIHHQARNLIVLGASVFPTVGISHPTLTLAAISLRAADKLMSSQH